MAPAAPDVTVFFRVPDVPYETEFPVMASAFRTYQLQLTGQEFVALRGDYQATMKSMVRLRMHSSQ